MDDLQALEAQQAASSKFSIPPKAIKPCVAHILVHNPRDTIFNSNDRAYLLATELRSIGQKREKAAIILTAWNSDNSHTLRPNELKGIIARAYSKDHTYGCNHPMVVDHCPGRENCSYYDRLFARQGRYSEWDFYKRRWQRILSPTGIALYHGIRRLERVQNLKPRQLIVAPYDLISSTTGIAGSHLTENLRRLEEAGLIWWRKGQPYRWRKEATEIRRVIPIPKPKKDAKMRSL